ncbi:hypothetical protein Tco_1387039 [Tanacetum coccineum]
MDAQQRTRCTFNKLGVKTFDFLIWYSQEPWILFTDGSSCVDGSGAGLILTNPKEMEFHLRPRFEFHTTKMRPEYEARIGQNYALALEWVYIGIALSLRQPQIFFVAHFVVGTPSLSSQSSAVIGYSNSDTLVKTKEKNEKVSNENAEVLSSDSEKGFAIAALKNELRKLTGNSVNTKFAKPSILGKPVGQPLKNQSVVRQPTAFKSERPRISKNPRFSSSQVDVNKTTLCCLNQSLHIILPKGRESAPANPHHMIAQAFI